MTSTGPGLVADGIASRSQVNADGFGDPNNTGIHSLVAFDGLVFEVDPETQQPAEPAIPTLSTVGIILFGALLTALAIAVLRRRA